LAVVEVPSFESERRSGKSNLLSFRDGSRVLRTIINGVDIVTGACQAHQ